MPLMHLRVSASPKQSSVAVVSRLHLLTSHSTPVLRVQSNTSCNLWSDNSLHSDSPTVRKGRLSLPGVEASSAYVRVRHLGHLTRVRRGDAAPPAAHASSHSSPRPPARPTLRCRPVVSFLEQNCPRRFIAIWFVRAENPLHLAPGVPLLITHRIQPCAPVAISSTRTAHLGSGVASRAA